ncbi:MAG: hypothetical protein ACN4G0_05845 [Polyangiales bacterium]
MRWSILVMMLLSLACSKKEAAPAEPEQAAETEPAPSPDGAEPKPGEIAAPMTAQLRPLDSPELPRQLQSPAPPVDAPPVVTLIEPGDEPRQTLRWDVKPGVEHEVSFAVGFTIDALVVVMRVGEPIYLVNYDLTLRSGKVERDGSVHVEFEVDDVTVNEKTIGDKRLGRIKKALSSAKKISGSYKLGPRGHMTELEMNVPKDATRTGHDMADNLRWALLQMTPALPQEPVGKGARWKVHEGLQQGGIHVNQLSTIEVVKVEGSRVELATQAQQTAAPQAFNNPGIAIVNQLKLLGAEADGSLDWDLTQLAPRAADLSSNVLKSVDQPTKDPKNPTIEVIVKASRAVHYAAD